MAINSSRFLHLWKYMGSIIDPGSLNCLDGQRLKSYKSKFRNYSATNLSINEGQKRKEPNTFWIHRSKLMPKVKASCFFEFCQQYNRILWFSLGLHLFWHSEIMKVRSNSFFTQSLQWFCGGISLLQKYSRTSQAKGVA